MTELEKLEKEFEEKKMKLMMKNDILLKLNNSSIELNIFSDFISFTDCSVETTKKILDTFVAEDWFVDSRGISEGYGNKKDRPECYTNRTEMKKSFPYRLDLDDYFGTTIKYPSIVNGVKYDIHIRVRDSKMHIIYNVVQYMAYGVCEQKLEDCTPVVPQCFNHKDLKVQTWGSVDHHPYSYTYYMTAPQENELELIKHFVDCICSV